MAADDRATFDPRTVSLLDWGIFAAGLMAYVFSFVNYYTATGRNVTVTETAWHGFFGWFAMLLALAGSIAVALANFFPRVRVPFGTRVVAVVAYVCATACAVLAYVVVPRDGFCYGDICGNVPSDLVSGHTVGYWGSLTAVGCGLVLSLARLRPRVSGT